MLFRRPDSAVAITYDARFSDDTVVAQIPVPWSSFDIDAIARAASRSADETVR